MVAEFLICGSCSSRNIFNSKINEDYKSFFNIHPSLESVNFISLMSNPVEYNEKLLNSDNDYDNTCVRNDLTKDFLNVLRDTEVDYLIIDTFFDVACGIVIVDENSYLTESPRLIHTDYYKLLNDKKRLRIFENFDEYYNLWKKSINLFFNFMENNCRDIKIILNCSRSVYKYWDNSQLIEDDNLRVQKKYNPVRDMMDTYILENFDVEVLPFNNDILADKNHIFGLYPVHYEKKYYEEKNEQLNKIIHRNSIYEYDNLQNKYFRKMKRENIISNFNSK